MKQLIIISFVFFSVNSFGQFAIVNDKEGNVNVRENGMRESKVIDKLKNGHFIYCFEKKGNWMNIDYTKSGKELNGYIYDDRFTLISKFPTLTKIKDSENLIVLKIDSVEVTITKNKFDKKKHNFKYVKDYPTQIELIDNKKYWGCDGGMPITQFEKIIIKVGSKIIKLPQTALEGLYQPNIYNAAVNFDKANNTIYIQTMNSDGAGGYFVIWKVVNEKYIERYIAYGF